MEGDGRWTFRLYPTQHAQAGRNAIVAQTYAATTARNGKRARSVNGAQYNLPEAVGNERFLDPS